jgi:hypothetical protein
MAANLSDLLRCSADAYYFVDTNIVFGYHKNDVPGLRDYVDFLSQMGKRFFITERIQKEVISIPVPAPFHLYKSPIATALADRSYPQVMREFACKSPKFETDVKWLLEAGYCLAECPDIPPEAVANDGVCFAMTGNAVVLRKFLGSPQGRRKFETIVDNYALEHLANIRRIDMRTGHFEDTFTLPTLATP